MKKSLLFIAFLVVFLGTFAGLNGLTTWTVPGTYTTLSEAVTALNGLGALTDSYVVDVAPGYAESIAAPILLTATGTETYSITIQKASAGSNPLITRTDTGSFSTSTFGGQGDAVIIIEGSDYVTFDGIDVAASVSSIEYGYYFRKASVTDGNKFDTIKNCTVTMTKGTSQYVIGIYSSNNSATSLVTSATGITVTSTGGRSESLVFTGNTVQNVHACIALRGFNHTASPYNFYDQNMVVGQSGAGNILQNFAGGSANAAYGVYLIYQTSPTVSYNTIANAAGGGSNATSTLYGMFFSTSSAGGTMVFNNNTLTLSQGSSSLANSIHVAPNGTSVSIVNNILNYGTFNSTTASYGIFCSNSTPNMTITGNSNSMPITKTGAGNYYPYYDNGSPVGGVATIANNNFSNITFTGASNFYGIQHTTSSTQVVNAYGNTISNITGGTGAIYGINVTYGAAGSSVYNNTVTNITNGGTLYGMSISTSTVGMSIYNNTINGLTGSGASVVCGIYTGGAASTGTANIYQHKIYNISSNNPSGSAWGIYIGGGSGITNVYDNMIYDIMALGSTTAATTPAIGGIRISGGNTNNVHYNSVYLTYAGSNEFFATAGLYITSGTTNEIRNNIFDNQCSPGPLGRSAGIWKSTSAVLNLGVNSNKNIYWTGDGPDATRPIAYINAVAYPTLTEYKSYVADRDLASYSEVIPWMSFSGDVDLHIDPAIPTRLEGNAVALTALCDVDFDGDDRSDSNPDIGADEGDFTAFVAAPGAPLYSSPANDGTGIAINAPLVWNASSEGGTPSSYEVYFDQADGSTYYETVTASPSNPPREWGKTYYWKIKAINGEGDAEGPVWKFDTAAGVPELIYPGHTSVDMPAFLTFTWVAIPGSTYKISCGTTPGGTDVQNMTVCASNSFALLSPLAYSTPYYWSVYAVNGAQEVQSAEWSFTTMTDPTIYNFPYTEGFDGTTFPPANWTRAKISGGGAGLWDRVTTGSSPTCAPVSGAGMARYNSFSFASGTIGTLITPPISFGSESYEVVFWMYRDTGYSTYANEGVKVFYGTNPSLTGATEIEYIHRATGFDPIVAAAGWYQYAVAIPSGAKGIGYLIFEGISEYGSNMFIDEVAVNEIPVNPVFEYTPTSINFGQIFQSVPSTWVNVTVTNTGGGTLSLAAGDITIFGTDATQFSFDPVNLPASLDRFESVVIPVRYTASIEGIQTATLRIANSAKANYDVSLQGEGLPEGLIGIGNGTVSTLNLPINAYFGYTYSQSIYLQSEITLTDPMIAKIYYYWNGLAEATASNDWVIYMGHTANTEFATVSSWIPLVDLQEVFNGEVELPNVPGWVEIELTTPFAYNHVDNLVIAVEENELDFDGSTEKFLGTATTGYRSLINFSDTTNQDPALPPNGTRLMGIANIMLELNDDLPLPIELSSFTAMLTQENLVNLTWVTQSETGVQGYYVYRSATNALTNALVVSPMIDATNTTQQQTYQFTDNELTDSGTYYYWLQNIDFGGNMTFHGPISVYYSSTGTDPVPEIPLFTELKAVYPNPFNPTAFIPYSIAKTANVSFKIYNARGQLLRHFDLGTKAPGNYQITWNGTDSNGSFCGNGIYYIIMKAGKDSFKRKTVLLK